MKYVINSLMVLMSLCLLVGATCLMLADDNPPPGISFYVLGVVYPAAEKQDVALTTYNKSPASYLMQSWIRPVDPATGDVNLNWRGSPVMPFTVTPPLSRIEANGELTLLIRRNNVPLHDNCELVFYVSMKALPAQQPAGKQMVMTVVSNMKRFYRPKGLVKRLVKDMAPKLMFRRAGMHLTAINPTPYWLTFSRLAVGGLALDKPALRLMVPPFEQQSYTLPSGATGKITWQLIDEDCWDIPVAQQK